MKPITKKIFIITIIFLFLYSFSQAKEIENDYFKNKSYKPTIENYLNIGHTSKPIISPDGKTIYFFNSFKANQLFKITYKNLYPYQITFTKKGVLYPELSPDGKYIVYSSDNNGNEQYQLNLLRTSDGRSEPLTNYPNVRYNSVLFSPKGDKIFFSCNKANKKYMSIYQLNLKTRKITPIITGVGYFYPSAISEDEKFLIYTESFSNVNSNLNLINLKTGKKELLTPHKGKVKNYGVALSPDNSTLYFITDNNPQGVLKLAAMNLKDKKWSIIFDKNSRWGIDTITPNRNKDIFAIVVNENGYGILNLYNIKNKKLLPFPNLKGIVSSVTFSNTGKIAFNFNPPTKVPEIYTWNMKTEQLRQLTKTTYAGINPKTFIEPKLIHYKSFDGLKIPAFLYLPKNYRQNMSKIPFIISFHGGPEGQSRPYFQRNINYLLSRGFGLLMPNIRGSDGYGKKYLSLDDYKKRMDSVRDGYYAAKYLINKGYTQKGRIGIRGGSYGGFMVMALITEYPDMWGAAYEAVGIVDFVNFLKNTSDYRRSIREKEYGPLNDKAFLKSVSPIHKLHRIKTPLMIFHGKNDPRVPVSEAYLIIDNLKKNGVTVKSLIFEDEGHGVRKRKNLIKLYTEMMDFFEKHLNKP